MVASVRVFPRAGGLSADLRIFGIGIAEPMRAGMVHRPHGTAHYVAISFQSEAIIGCAGRQDAHPPGRMILWPPGSAHLYGNARTAWSHSWIAFDGTAVSALISGSGLPVDAVVPTGIGLAQEHFRPLVRELIEPTRPDPVIIRNLVHNWLRASARAITDERSARAAPEPFTALRRRFEDRCDEPIDLASIARQLRLSRWHLCRAYRRWFGVSPMEDLQRIRMQRAGLLARDPDLTVAEIARRSGYPDAFHFSKQFKKHYGASPTRFRGRLWGER